jgi:hypothetical protein
MLDYILGVYLSEKGKNYGTTNCRTKDKAKIDVVKVKPRITIPLSHLFSFPSLYQRFLKLDRGQCGWRGGGIGVWVSSNRFLLTRLNCLCLFYSFNFQFWLWLFVYSNLFSFNLENLNAHLAVAKVQMNEHKI